MKQNGFKLFWNWFQKLEFLLLLVVMLCITGPFLFNIRPFIVLSGSMEPVIHTGSIAYVDKNVLPEELENGDIVGFKFGDDFVTHRIVEINEEEKTFITKGDANESIDLAPIPFENVIGKTVYSIPYLGRLIVFIKTIPGLMILGGILVFHYVVDQLLKEDDEKEIKVDSKEIDV